ncbi:MAG: protein kinase [Isosphaeraceae bacterium]
MALAQSDPAARQAFLDEACAGDEALRRRIQTLLDAHERQGSILDRPTIELDSGEAGEVIAGKYTLIKLIGEGGMGSVHLARQTEPVRREVALKLIRSGMDSRTVLARFEAERQALALMDHPNIARVFDGGSTASGQPFFVMEYVRGVPITEYCDANRMSPTARLELFVPVCRAVQHAHQKGIIHRDLKPGNVLVTEVDGRPTPKVIDFGVAKAIERRLTDQSFGDTGAIVGTPTYMSPEQADPSSMDVDTRTDVYALGVMLYEILAGSPPVDPNQFRRGAVLEMLRMVREVEPPRPSTRLSTAPEIPNIAARRNVEPSHLVRWLRGDIDWIVMKALEKSRDRRYETANGFAADIVRFLANEPVVARPPSRRYRLRKFVRRNRTGVIAASLVLLALLVGLVGTTLALIEARAQRAAAERARLLAIAESEAKERARQAEAEQRALAEQANRQAFEALRSFTDEVMGEVIGGREKLTEAERTLLRNAQKQWEVFAQSKGDSPEARLIRSEGAAELSILQYKLGMNAEAVANDRTALALRAGLAAEFPNVPIYRRKLGLSHQNLGGSLRGEANRAEAETHFKEAAEIFLQLAEEFPDEPSYRARAGQSLTSVANAMRGRGDWAAAERAYRDAIAIHQRLADEFPDQAAYRDDLVGGHWGLAFNLKRAGKPEEAETEYRRALALIEKLAADFPADRSYQVQAANLGRELGVLLYDEGKDEAGAALFPNAIATLERLAADFPSIPVHRYDLLRCRRDYAKVLGLLDRPVEATEQFQKSIALGERLVAEHPTVLNYQHELGLCHAYLANLIHQGDAPADSLASYDKAILTLTKAHEADRQVVLTRNALYKALESRAQVRNHLGRHAEALTDWERAIDLAPPERLPAFRAQRAATKAELGQFTEALAELAEVTKVDPRDPVHWYNFARAQALASAGDEARKEEYAAKAVELLQQAVNAGYANVARMTKDAALNPLRDREYFKKLLADLSAKFPPDPTIDEKK